MTKTHWNTTRQKSRWNIVQDSDNAFKFICESLIWVYFAPICMAISNITMLILKTFRNLYLADTFGTFPSVRLIEVVKLAQCLFTISIQLLLCTVIKFHVVKEAIQSSSSLPFITNFNLFVNAKTLTDFSTYFKDVIQYYYCQFSPVSA